MRPSPELLLSGVLISASTLAYVPLALHAPPAASGLVGHGLGVLGFAAMLAGSFGYSWRKRPGRSGPGSLQRWLQAHVVTGFVGPYLVLLHTAFAFRGLAGATFLLMLVVVGSGVAGRLAYTSVPKVATTSSTNGADPRRRRLAWWWVVHVPLALALFALAILHAAAALYYATLLR